MNMSASVSSLWLLVMCRLPRMMPTPTQITPSTARKTSTQRNVVATVRQRRQQLPSQQPLSLPSSCVSDLRRADDDDVADDVVAVVALLTSLSAAHVATRGGDVVVLVRTVAAQPIAIARNHDATAAAATRTHRRISSIVVVADATVRRRRQLRIVWLLPQRCSVRRKQMRIQDIR